MRSWLSILVCSALMAAVIAFLFEVIARWSDHLTTIVLITIALTALGAIYYMGRLLYAAFFGRRRWLFAGIYYALLAVLVADCRFNGLPVRWISFYALLGTAPLVGVYLLIDLLAFPHRTMQPRGHCRQCGYDLHASRERCPECGTPVPPMWMLSDGSFERGMLTKAFGFSEGRSRGNEKSDSVARGDNRTGH